MAMSDLLAMTLTKDPRPNEELYVWERNALDWLAKQREDDPETSMNLWTYNRMRDYLAWRASLPAA